MLGKRVDESTTAPVQAGGSLKIANRKSAPVRIAPTARHSRETYPRKLL